MRPIHIIAIPCLLIILATAPALAEEIIYFTNGTSMPIRSHEVRGDMLHVDLGSDAFMAFPLYMVEKIEDAGKEVSLTPSFTAGNKIMAGRVPTPEGSYPVRGQKPGRSGDSDSSEPRIINRSEMYEDSSHGGVTTHRPLSGHRAANRRGLGTTGRTDLAQESTGQGDGGYLGTKKQGARHVIGGNDGRTGPDGRPKTATPMSLNRSAAGANKQKTGD